MKLTKDEARILAALMDKGKYELNDMIEATCKRKAVQSMSAFESLEKRLTEYGDDKRRHGRTSINHFTAVLMRFVTLNAPGNDPGM